MDILKIIEKEYDSFPKQEKKVALFVLQQPKKVQTLSITNLAKIVGVSDATITRLGKDLKCRNFTDLKIKLSRSISEVHQKNTTKPNATETRVYDFYSKVLSDTLKNLDIKQIKKAVKLISTSARVYIYGIGSSGYTAMELGQRLLRMGISAFAITESQNMLMNSSIMNKKDLIIAISSSGETEAVVKALKVGQNNGAVGIGITGVKTSSLAKNSDILITAQNTNFLGDARFINSQFSIVYVIDIITTLLLDNKDYNERMTRTIMSIM